jgi:hypothetical protein
MPETNFTILKQLRKPISPDRVNNLIGVKFTRVTPLAFLGMKRKAGAFWLCKCDCGIIWIVRASQLLNSRIKSCGCYNAEQPRQNFIHGLSGTRLYAIFRQMHRRCYNPKCDSYHNYGGRGIAVCERWHSFESFRADVGIPPSKTHSIDRYPDKNGDYHPDNFRWATRTEQNRNTRSNRMVTINSETLSVAEWSERTGVSRAKIYDRLSRPTLWTLEQAIGLVVKEH